jgi:hypothetical protein
MSATRSIVKNNTLAIPAEFSESWKSAEVAVISPSQDTLILKRLYTPSMRLSYVARRNKRARMSRSAVNREIAAHRSRK